MAKKNQINRVICLVISVLFLDKMPGERNGYDHGRSKIKESKNNLTKCRNSNVAYRDSQSRRC